MFCHDEQRAFVMKSFRHPANWSSQEVDRLLGGDTSPYFSDRSIVTTTQSMDYKLTHGTRRATGNYDFFEMTFNQPYPSFDHPSI